MLRAPFDGPAEVVAFDCRWHPSRATGRLKITPWFEGMRPVISVLRFGIHTGFDTHAFSKTGATLGERIEAGLLTTSLPMKPQEASRRGWPPIPAAPVLGPTPPTEPSRHVELPGRFHSKTARWVNLAQDRAVWPIRCPIWTVDTSLDSKPLPITGGPTREKPDYEDPD